MECMSTGFVRTLLHSKLLTDDDRILVEDALTDSAVKFPSNQRFFTFLIGFFAILVGVVFWAEQNDNLLLYNITIGVSIAFTFVICVGLFPLLLVPLTRYGIRSWNNSDRTVHLFLAGLKRRETYIYGLQQALEASENYVCAPQSRLQCISELRNVIHHCREFSGKFLEELDLKSADEYANTAILEMADENQLDIREDQVEVQALKALWQFMFIHRSESLRNLALSHLDAMNKLISSSKYLSATAAARSTLFQLLRHILNTKKITVKLQDVEVNRESYGEKSNIQKVFEGGAGVEDLERLKAQAEFMLNQLYRLKKLPEDRRFLMKILCEMADIIGKEANEYPKKPPNKRPKSLKDELEGDVDDNEGDENQEQRISYDFEVFEGEIGDQVEHKVDIRLEDEVDINSPMRVTSLRDELKAALTKRKADFDQRQLAALARLKNCTVEEVIRQEMERKNVAAPVQPQERVVYAPQQRLNISAADLMAAMKSRPKIDALGDIEE